MQQSDADMHSGEDDKCKYRHCIVRIRLVKLRLLKNSSGFSNEAEAILEKTWQNDLILFFINELKRRSKLDPHFVAPPPPWKPFGASPTVCYMEPLQNHIFSRISAGTGFSIYIPFLEPCLRGSIIEPSTRDQHNYS